MSLTTTVKKLWFALTDKKRLVLLDYPVDAKRMYSEESNTPHKALYQLIAAGKEEYKKLLHAVNTYRQPILSIKKEKDNGHGIEPGWNNGYLPGLDMIMLYTLLAEIKPAKYIEIGSGTSTRVAYKVKRDHNLSFTITSIDPSPRKEIKSIVDQWENKELQKVSLAHFQTLEENDIVFFDGTHTLYPNSDVTWFFLEVLPLLKKGVYVHFHDVYLPYDYPQFMCDRFYNEQYILAGCLLSNPEKYSIVCPNYFIYADKGLHTLLDYFWKLEKFNTVETHGGSFWIRIEK